MVPGRVITYINVVDHISVNRRCHGPMHKVQINISEIQLQQCVLQTDLNLIWLVTMCESVECSKVGVNWR